MHVVANSLDDLLRKVYPRLMRSAVVVRTSRGDTKEIFGALLEIRNPRARISRTETRGRPFSALGELLWYLSKDNRLDFIYHYIERYAKETEDGETVYGGYGPRLFKQRGIDQIQNIIDNLRKGPSTRRAVVQIFNAEDIVERHEEIPCTTTFQFVLRDGKLNMLTTMRSNDAYIGLPHDVFCFTMLQEIIARCLKVKVGTYLHSVGSLHYYTNDEASMDQFLSEGVQANVPMPPMPMGDPWESIQKVIRAEHLIRNGMPVDHASLKLHPYWLDLIYMLEIFAGYGQPEYIEGLKKKISFKKYDLYIARRRKPVSRAPLEKKQLRLDI